MVLLAASMAVAGRFSWEGVTEPYAQAVIGSTVSGKVDDILVAEGQTVKKGEVLLELEREEERLSAEMARIVAQSKADLQGSEAKEATLERDFRATRQLFDSSNSVSEEMVWQKELEWKLATAERARLAMLEEKEALEHKLAEAQVARRVVRSPFQGVVVKLHKREAESVQALEPLVEVVDVRRCRLVAYVAATEAQSLRTGQELTIQLDGAAKPRVRKGRIEFLSPVVDRSSMLRTVKVVFDNADGSIEPGVSGRIVPPTPAQP